MFLDLSLNSAVADPAEGPGGGGAEPLNQTEARRAEKKLFWRPGSPLSKGLDNSPRPLSQGLDPALPETRKFRFMAQLRAGNSRNMSNRNV